LRLCNRTVVFVAVVCLAFAFRAETQQTSSASPSHANETAPVMTFRSATRMVTIDVVARDGKGNSLRDPQD